MKVYIYSINKYHAIENLLYADCHSLDEIQPSLWEFLGTELRRSYALEHDEEHYHARREKVYSFMKIPREVEKFMIYGFMQVCSHYLWSLMMLL